ncbi:bacterial Ig-like domain-containing protein [Lactococcus garvieae]|uniref:bacterial Ig-like domain-containing protein n=2 Tax=Lactococcus garvieae TaxID=1363 RepID=UPI00254E7D10|nr:bacterial Ig-like domain-containing protein [Lactococcus garvieae]
MMNRKEKTIKYRIRTGSQWLLVSLLAASTILPGINETVYASTKEVSVLENIDTNQEKKIEKLSEKDTNDVESSSTAQENAKNVDNIAVPEGENTFNGDTDSEKPVKETDDIASGKFGTSEWRIDTQGTLYIGEGEFSDTTSSLSPWNNWAEEITKIYFDGKVVAGNIMAGLFRGMPNLLSIENIQNLDTSNTTDMRVVFKESSSLKYLDLTSWSTSKVTTIYGIFDSASSLEGINVSNWDVSNCNQLAYSFRNLSHLKELDLSQWNPSPKTETLAISTGGYISMFEGDSSLESLDLSGFSTSGMNSYYLGKTSFDNMFLGMTSLKVLTLGSDFKFNIQYPTTANLPNITATDRYTGKWVNVGNGTLDSPESSRVWSSSTLMVNLKYNSSYLGATETYVWQRIKGANVTVKYEEESGQPIADEEILQGYVGDEYKGAKKDIDGYTFKEVKENNATGVFTDQAQTVTYVYTKNPVAGADITIKYVDEKNQSIPGISDKIISGNVGDIYDVSTEDYQISIPNYHLDTANLPENMIGQISETPQDVVYRYIIDKTALNVHDSTLYVGDTWSAEDNFDSALDKDGNKVDFKDVKVSGDVDTTKAGSYEITYSYDGVESKAVITVKEKQTALNVHDSTLYVGDNWSPEDNFDSALDKDGQAVDFKDVKVSGNVDTTKAGSYEITYSYGGLTSTAKVTVLKIEEGQDLAHIVVHDSELQVGEDWLPEDNFDEATLSDGQEENFSDIIVNGTVDTKKPGTYEVTYSIPEEHLGRNIVEGHYTATAKIVVSEKKGNDDRDSNSKGENSDSEKDNSSSTNNTSGKNDFQNIKGLPKTGEHTSALVFMMGIALLVLGSIFSVLRVKKNKK